MLVSFHQIALKVRQGGFRAGPVGSLAFGVTGLSRCAEVLPDVSTPGQEDARRRFLLLRDLVPRQRIRGSRDAGGGALGFAGDLQA